ncbi:MAG: peptidylprolyl isomerase [Hamadaea sp.]|nr:peptidylprolyl isomerase [Hamadaea sp.]NUR52300.1 peptidylprolyl isomerase [Hamadaea sp.]NUT06159.1 peptidylprolyl isomerase [Hamadaea sp.]
MASSKTRARKLARAKLNRQLARQAESQRRGRQVRAGVAVGLAVLLVGAGALWLLGVFDKDKTPTAQTQCEWTKQDTSANPDLADKGVPTTSGLPDTGNATMNLALGTGTVTATLDRAGATCGAASLRYLADQNFFNGTACHALTHTDAEGYALACGDPSGKGTGGVAYTFFSEQPAPEATASAAPSASASAAPSTLRFYQAGTVVMEPAVSGSQFRIFYKDSTVDSAVHNYSVVGQVSSGLNVIEAIAKAGTVANDSGADVKPKTDVKIQTLTVTDTQPTTEPTGSAAPSGSAAPTASASPSASAS